MGKVSKNKLEQSRPIVINQFVLSIIALCLTQPPIQKCLFWLFQSFRLTPIERGFLLAPGLKITRHVHYTCTKLGIVHSTLPIFVNEKCFELPLES